MQEQEVLKAQQDRELVVQRAAERRQQAEGIAAAHRTVGSTLTPQVLSEV